MAYHTITIDVQGPRKEALAGGTITPGDLLERTTTADTVQCHSTKKGNVTPKIFARENDLVGNDIDDNYSSGEQVQMFVALPGDEVYVNIASDQTVAINDKLSSNGDGDLTVFQAYEDSSGLGETHPSESIVAVALEALTATATTRRIRAEVV